MALRMVKAYAWPPPARLSSVCRAPAGLGRTLQARIVAHRRERGEVERGSHVLPRPTFTIASSGHTWLLKNNPLPTVDLSISLISRPSRPFPGGRMSLPTPSQVILPLCGVLVSACDNSTQPPHAAGATSPGNIVTKAPLSPKEFDDRKNQLLKAKLVNQWAPEGRSRIRPVSLSWT